MKKILLAVCVAALFTACNSEGSQTDATTTTTDTTDRSMMSTTPYTPTQGDATFKDQTLMVYKGDKWVSTDKEMTMGNGAIVYTNGTVKNGEITDTLTDGEIVSHSGDLYDKTGNAIHGAWDATKKGVNDAGDSVKEGVNKAGDAAKEGINKAGDAAKEGVNKAGDAAGKGLSAAGQAANKAVKDTKDAMDKK